MDAMVPFVTDLTGVLAGPMAPPTESALQRLHREAGMLLEPRRAGHRGRRLRRIAALRGLVERAELEEVGAARDARLSWTAIGECLGISRQAARQRFAPRLPDRTDGGERGAAVDAATTETAALVARAYEVVDLLDSVIPMLVPDHCTFQLATRLQLGGAGRLWREVRERFGELLRAGAARSDHLGQYAVVEIALEFERGPAALRLAFEEGGLIHGILVLAAEDAATTAASGAAPEPPPDAAAAEFVSFFDPPPPGSPGSDVVSGH